MTYYVVYIFAMAGLEGNINLIASGVQYALFIVFTTIMFVSPSLHASCAISRY